jgi:hypothetical protein
MLTRWTLLRSIGKALVRHGGNAVGLGVLGDALVDVGEDVWKEWQDAADADARRAEVEALAHAAARDCRAQVEAIVRDVAADLPAQARQAMADYLQQVPARLRQSLGHRSDSVPCSAHDLLRLLAPADEVPAVVLTVATGPLEGQRFVFAERTSTIVGRAAGCTPRLPTDAAHRTISRHHCLLDINPPDVRIRDFGSLNGTILNGTKIGKRERGVSRAEAARIAFPEHDLKDGDEIRLGRTVFRVEVILPQVPPGTIAMRCARCGRDVAAEVGVGRHGEYVCAACKQEPLELITQLLAQAAAGAIGLAPVRDYVLHQEVGRGAHSTVYRVCHRQTGEPMALKLLLPEVAADAHAKCMILREIGNLRTLVHPNIVRLRAAGCWQGALFLLMDFCHGRTAQRWIEQHGPMPISQAAAVFRQVLDGLAHAHALPVPLVHRDLRPQNVFLCGDGTVARIGDYGLARAFDAAGLSGQTRTGQAAVRPTFMPRHQVVNFKDAGPEVDTWAAAALFYFLVTGHPPRDFPADRDPWQVALERDPVPLRRRDPAIPARLAAVIDRALVDRSRLRFGSARELRQALEGILY